MTGAAVTGPLLERSGELARIESALTEARNGSGTFVVIEGSAGIGKTSLLAATRAAALGSGMRILRARPTELEREFAFGVVRQLFEPALVDASDAERAELLEGAAGVAAGLLGLGGRATVDVRRGSEVDRSFAILHGLYWLCANLAVAGPLCVVVDDAQWADAPSLRYLAFLVTRLEELSVTLLVATRPSDPGVDPELLATLMAAPSADVVRLHPLTRTAVAQLLESALEDVPDPAFVDACLRATRGTPFLVGELVVALRGGGITPTAQAAREVERIGARSIGRSIQLRLGLLPNSAIRLARALAVLEHGDLVHAARLAELKVAEATDAADRLAQAGILESSLPLEFVHPIVRRSVYEGLSGPERAQAHRRAAHVLAEQPVASARVAQHLLATEPAGDDWTVKRLVGAASAASRQGAPETEAVFLRRALAEPAPPDDEPALLLELGMAEASAGLDGWTEHLARAVDAAPSGAAATDAAIVLADALSRAQRFVEAVEVLDRAASSLGPGDGELALRLQAAAVVPAMNDPATAPSVASRRSALREHVDDPGAPPELLAAVAFTSVAANEPAELGVKLAGRALLAGRIDSADSEGRPWFSFTTRFSRTTLALLWLERYDQLGPLLDESIAEARATGDGGRLAAGLAHRGWLALRRGDLRAAEVDSRTALAATELPAPPIYRVFQTGLLVEALTDQGELAAAEETLAPVDSEAERPALNATLLRFARGRLRLEQGRAKEGLDDVLAVGEVLVRAQVVSPSFLPWRSEAALAELALGRRESARRLADDELELARAFGTPRARGVALRAAGLVAGGEHGKLLLREAVDALEDAGARLERARALADLGAMLRRRNRRTDARELLREALDIAHRAGAASLAARAETELRATGARPRRVVLTGLESLTASERRIAELASQSLTNREIAQQLFITDRTVEGHLTSVFRKLRLESRTELATALAQNVPVSA